MCTVTFIPSHNKVFITHNRDEQSSRTKAIAPKEYTVNGYTLLFPRDSTAVVHGLLLIEKVQQLY